jgi:cytochrome P450
MNDSHGPSAAMIAARAAGRASKEGMAIAGEVVVKSGRDELRLPPGPGVNLLVSVLQQKRWVDPIAHFGRLAARYGDISHYRIGRRDIVFINHPDYLREVFVVQAANFVKERTQQRAKLLLGEGMITADGGAHKEQRQAAAPAFYRQKMASHAGEIVRRAIGLGEQWAATAPAAGSAALPVIHDIHREMMELALGILGATLLETDLGDEVRTLNDAMADIMEVYNAVVLLPGIRLLLQIPFTPLRKFVHARARLHRSIDWLIAERRGRTSMGAPYLPQSADVGASSGGDLLSLLLEAQRAQGWSDEYVRDQVITVTLAGFETVAIGLTWTWYLLSQNPQAEARMHQELDAVLGGRLPGYDDLPRLRYTEMVMAEALRLYPPAWAMGRRSINAFDLGSYRLPAGTTVLASQYILHRDARFFPDPLRFDPERHTPEAKAARPRGAYCPFGMGPRQCIGEAFAWMEGVLVLATLAQRWKLRHDERHEVVAEPLFTLRPKNGMPMRVEAR